MGTYVALACCMVLCGCLLPSANSETHKKKIIVKVPHLVKHIHYNHFKPVHVHKVRAKKVEHHHHSNHEDTLSSWKHSQKKTKKGKQKIHGSFSNLKPILLHQEIEEHMEYPGDGGETHELVRNQRVGHRLEFEQTPRLQFSQEDIFWNPEDRPTKRRNKFREDNFNRGETFKRDNVRVKPIDFSKWLNEEDDRATSGQSGEIWDSPSEDLSYTRKQHRLPNNKQSPKNERKIKKAKNLNWRSKEESSEIESDGWKPMVDFNAWNNFNDMESHHQENIFNSGEYMVAFSDGIHHQEHEEGMESSRKKKRKPNIKKTRKVSKQVEALDQGGNNELVKQNLPQHPFQTASPQSPILPQIQPQFFQPLQPQQIQPYSIPLPQAQRTSWPQVNWPIQQPAGSSWQTQPLSEHQPQAQPPQTITPKVVWSGHHLQMPQHSMWHVQQHSNGASPLQTLTVNQNPLQALQFYQPHSPPQQLTQESSPVHQVVPPGWPLTRKSPDSSVKQHWEQHVQTSGSDGPASSYRVEVINYTDKKNT